jgi:hypothetical protein
MDYLWNAITHWGYNLELAGIRVISGDHDIQRQTFIARLIQWNTALQGMLQQYEHNFSAVEDQASKILQVQQYSALLVLAVVDFRDDMIWDLYTADFEAMTNLASDVAASSTASFSMNNKTVPNFSLDSGIVGPLFQVAYRCRSPALRRRAIAVLGASPRQEGVWDGVLVARVCERIVDIEEEGLGQVQSCSDIPSTSRITNVDVQFDLEGRQAVMTYVRPLCGENVQDIITW